MIAFIWLGSLPSKYGTDWALAGLSPFA